MQIRYEIKLQSEDHLYELTANQTIIRLYWSSFEYLKIEQQWVWTLATFLAAIGGSVSLWLGLSVLSLIQGGAYLYSFLTEKKRKAKEEKKNRIRGGDNNNDNINLNARRTTSSVEQNDINEKRSDDRMTPSASQNGVSKRDDDNNRRHTRIRID